MMMKIAYARPAMAAGLIALLAVIAGAPLQARAQAPAPLPTIELSAGVHLITAEVASTEKQRSYGLMFRRQLAPNHGMLFIFDRPQAPCMWMRNTLIPLSVAFIDSHGLIANVEEMEPGTEALHCARAEVIYALEMDRNWFAGHGQKAGQGVIRGLPPAPAGSGGPASPPAASAK